MDGCYSHFLLLCYAPSSLTFLTLPTLLRCRAVVAQCPMLSQLVVGWASFAIQVFMLSPAQPRYHVELCMQSVHVIDTSYLSSLDAYLSIEPMLTKTGLLSIKGSYWIHLHLLS